MLQYNLAASAHIVSLLLPLHDQVAASRDYKVTFLAHTLPLLRAPLSFDRDLQAIRKRHSTTDEALKVAEEMAAACTVLTHFSSRYPKVTVLIPYMHTLQCIDVHIWCIALLLAADLHQTVEGRKMVACMMALIGLA